ncbi:hypothetical protein ACROYT_G017171 [Oculina patagonica]
MTAQKQSLPSFASVISVLSIVFYCVGFFRVELQLNEQMERINALESVAEAKPPSLSNNHNSETIKNFPEVIQKLHRSRRQADTTKNATENKNTAEAMITLFSQLCKSKSDTCSSGPPGPPGPPGPRGHKGARGRRGQKAKTGNKGNKGIMGPVGLKGDTGPKGEKGDIGPEGMPGTKGESGPSGLPGPYGPRGQKGARGRRGQKGGTGNKGDKGIIGSPGKSGNQGIMGPAGLKGETGIKGEKGDIGPAGMPGTKGDIGPTGMPGYKGNIGPRGMLGTKGNKGAAGMLGRKGNIGAAGMPGYKGNTGPRGMPGTKGNKGAAGMPGYKGNTGPRGMPGTKGNKGAAGMPGTKGEPGGLISYLARDCYDLLKSGHTQSGLYFVNPDGRESFTVYCDMRTDGGGWTVFQRRQDGSVDFYRGWNDYKAGFGQLTAEFWLGNDKIHRLTASRPSSLRVELEDWSGGKAYAKYGKFNIGDEQALYRLEVGSYSGTAGDSMTRGYNLNNMAFSTKDRDNDRISPGYNCAVAWTGAWWYNNCQYSNLNGRYLGEKNDTQGVRWGHFRYSLSLKFAEMKLRPSS